MLVTHDYHTHQGNPIVHTWGGKLRDSNREVGPAEAEEGWPFMESINRARSMHRIFGTTRVNLLLGIGPESQNVAHQEEINLIRSSRFGLGTKRSLDQAMEFTGIDLVNRKMVKNKCGNLLWTPFEESENYGVPDILRRLPIDPAVTTNTPEMIRGETGHLNHSTSLDKQALFVKHVATSSSYAFYGGAFALSALSLVSVTRRLLRRKIRHKPVRHTN